jgi:hypothetical protein
MRLRVFFEPSKTIEEQELTMPRVRLPALIEEIHGTFYDVVFKMSPKGNMIVTRRPDMSQVKWSKAQQEQQQRFKAVIAYAKAAFADPKLRAGYEKRAQREHKRAWDVALADHLHGKDLLAKPIKKEP